MTVLPSATPTDTSYESYNNFTAGQTYSFFIRARNTAGLTRDSNPISVTIPSNICSGSFSLSSVEPRCNASGLPGVLLTWTASSGATSYQIFRNGSAFGNSNDTSYESYNNFTAGPTYSFSIRALNSAGFVTSNTESITIPSDICGTSPGAFPWSLQPVQPHTQVLV